MGFYIELLIRRREYTTWLNFSGLCSLSLDVVLIIYDALEQMQFSDLLRFFVVSKEEVI